LASKNPEDAFTASAPRVTWAVMPKKQRFYFVYILASLSGTLYTGITNSIYHRTLQHKNKETPGFTSKYDVSRLVYYERFNDVRAAIRREKEIKGWTRKKKIALVESMSPKWKDLAEGWGEKVSPASRQLEDPVGNRFVGDSSGPKARPSE
jgi:putative endonuclease